MKSVQTILTGKQENFAIKVAGGSSKTAAYRDVYCTNTMKPQSIYVEASRLAANPKVALRIDALEREMDEDRRIQAVSRLNYVLNALMREAETAVSDSARVRALELLGKRIGMFDGQREKDEEDEPTAEELKQLLVEKLAAFINLPITP